MPFHHPHTEPYTYLGVEITPTLNRSYQLEKVLKDIQQRGEKLKDNMISYRQKLNFVQTSIKPAALYAFPLAYLTHTDIGKLDKLYATVCKQSLGLPISTPTSLIYEDRLKGGAGQTSLLIDYTKAVAESLVQSLLDPGQFGDR